VQIVAPENRAEWESHIIGSLKVTYLCRIFPPTFLRMPNVRWLSVLLGPSSQGWRKVMSSTYGVNLEIWMLGDSWYFSCLDNSFCSHCYHSSSAWLIITGLFMNSSWLWISKIIVNSDRNVIIRNDLCLYVQLHYSNFRLMALGSGTAQLMDNILC
jgi:hypothetical protein